MVGPRRSILVLPLALPLACVTSDPSGDGTTTLAGSSTSSGAVTSTTSSGLDASTTTSDPTSGSTSLPTTTEAADTTAGPIFDVGVVPDIPNDPPLLPTDIDVVLTADNAYAFGYGTEDEMLNYFGGVAAVTAGEIFNCGVGPELYTVPARDVAEYLYIVSYADQSTTQGVIGQFRRVSDQPDGTPGEVLHTGDEGWEVCATGVDYNTGDPTPPLDVVNEQIVACNEGTGDPASTSGGWVDAVGTALGALAVGETNETPYAGGPIAGNEFPLVCQEVVDAEARWMWFNWDPAGIVWPAQSPFIYPGGAGNPMHDFMIFRLAADSLPQPPAG
jgi:hypothetical protein